MFIISKRNFLVRRADGTSYLIRKDFVGDIPEDVFQSGLVQGAIKGGLIAAPQSTKDKDLYKADEEAGKKESEADIRPDAQKEETEEEQRNETEQETETSEETAQKKTTRKK